MSEPNKSQTEVTPLKVLLSTYAISLPQVLDSSHVRSYLTRKVQGGAQLFDKLATVT